MLSIFNLKYNLINYNIYNYQNFFIMCIPDDLFLIIDLPLW